MSREKIFYIMETKNKVDLASAVFIDVLIVIDTEYVKSRNSKQVNPDPARPVGIDHGSQFMIANDPRGIISGQGTADLNFRAQTNDYVQFRATSIYQNSDDAVVVYAIDFWQGVNVFNNFNCQIVTRSKAVQPNPATANGLPALNVPENFTSLDSKVAKMGREDFYVKFALYTMASDGETQELYGYFYWDPTVTVG